MVKPTGKKTGPKRAVLPKAGDIKQGTVAGPGGLAARLAATRSAATQRAAGSASAPRAPGAPGSAPRVAGKPQWVQRAQENTLAPKPFRGVINTPAATTKRKTQPQSKPPSGPKSAATTPKARIAKRVPGPANAPGMNRTGQSRKRFKAR